MTRTLLFFGDSNTRGYGVGRDRRYPTLIEAAVRGASYGDWRFAVATTQSDFRLIPPRLDAAIAEHDPEIVVWICPSGPLAYYVREPQWYERAHRLARTVLRTVKERHVRTDIARGGGEDRRPRRDALYEGRYIDDLYRWMPRTWPGVRHLRRHFAARYGTIVKATEGQYVELMRRHRERVRRTTRATLLFCSILPHSEWAYPGFNARAVAWNARLAILLQEPDAGSLYVDLYGPLTRRGVDANLLRDGMHLSPAGHRVVAEVLTPQLLALMDGVRTPVSPTPP